MVGDTRHAMGSNALSRMGEQARYLAGTTWDARNRHNRTYFAVVLTNLGAALAASVFGLALDDGTVAGALGAVSPSLTTLQGWFAFDARADHDDAKSTEFSKLARKCLILEERADDPTQEELNNLNDDLTAIQARRFARRPKPPANQAPGNGS